MADHWASPSTTCGEVPSCASGTEQLEGWTGCAPDWPNTGRIGSQALGRQNATLSEPSEVSIIEATTSTKTSEGQRNRALEHLSGRGRERPRTGALERWNALDQPECAGETKQPRTEGLLYLWVIAKRTHTCEHTNKDGSKQEARGLRDECQAHATGRPRA